MMKQLLFLLAALLVIASCELAADKTKENSVVEEHDDDNDVTVPELFVDEMDEDEDELESIVDENIGKMKNDAAAKSFRIQRRRRRWKW